MKNRIDTKFAALKAQGRKALIAFLTAGDPDEGTSRAAFAALLDNGADIIEIGMPFSDPMADGKAIQAANIRALAAGQTMKKTLALAADLSAAYPDHPIVLMGYANPIHYYGMERFVRDAKAAGVDGLIIVDLPPEENAALHGFCQAAGVHVIHLVTPTTDAARLRVILGRASGFVYYVAIAGVTGAAAASIADTQEKIALIRSQTDMPVVTGFGVKTAADAAAFGALCDGVVVGSALVDALLSAQNPLGGGSGAKGDGMSTLATLVRSLSGAL